MVATIICPICDRTAPKNYTEKHHLIPSAKGGKETKRLCINCADQIHELFTNNELRDKYNTIEKLLVTPEIQKWKKFISKRKDFSVCMKRKKKN